MRTIICMAAVLGSMGLTAGSCSDGQYQCQESFCIPDRWLCDSYPDCPFGDDETSCYSTDNSYTDTSSKPSCSDDKYECLSGECIPETWVCDNMQDCSSGDDEYDCDSTDDYSPDLTDVTSCPGYYYQCQYNGECIPAYWVCDGIGDCPVYGDDEDGCTSSAITTDTTSTPPLQECKSSFDYIFDRCVMVEPFTATNWHEARYLCERFDSDLVVLDDYNFYAEVLQYITNRGLDSHNYWVGATDQSTEGEWLWIDSSPVPSRAPLWALYGCTDDFQLEPRPSDAESQDCGFLDKDRGLYMSDGSCDESFATICQTTSGKKVTKNEEPIERKL